MISIVDDDPLVRDATVDLLNSLGYSALAFGSAEEFLNSDQVETTWSERQHYRGWMDLACKINWLPVAVMLR